MKNHYYISKRDLRSGEKSGRIVGTPVVIDVWVSADAILKTDVKVIPEAAMQHHIPHHAKPVLQL